MRFEVQLIPQGRGRWAALLNTGQLLSTEVRQVSEVASLLLRQGLDPRSQLVIRTGSTVIADEMLGVAGGAPVICSDVDMVERS